MAAEKPPPPASAPCCLRVYRVIKAPYKGTPRKWWLKKSARNETNNNNNDHNNHRHNKRALSGQKTCGGMSRRRRANMMKRSPLFILLQRYNCTTAIKHVRLRRQEADGSKCNPRQKKKK
ncbi:hypothetical protein OUZ56_013844 [Daphnia magna]|uniref:Uncharacterized protein n=1 Tax=Daphnia magna TaxID=35525 RepID=A0ABQ9Z756_9CRUS|nr:hypothetical protein OUZ56_013844 [Daphnia magna]